MGRSVVPGVALAVAMAVAPGLAGCSSSAGGGVAVAQPATSDATPAAATGTAAATGPATGTPGAPAAATPGTAAPGTGAAAATGTTATAVANATAGSQQERTILAQYRAFYGRGLVSARLDPEHAAARLSPFAADPQLSASVTEIATVTRLKEIYRGSPVLGATRLAHVTASTAEVHDCLDGSKAAVWKGDEQVVVGHPKTPTSTSLTRIDGVWKVTATSFPTDPAGYCD